MTPARVRAHADPSRTRSRVTTRSLLTSLPVSRPFDASEREAERIAARIADRPGGGSWGPDRPPRHVDPPGPPIPGLTGSGHPLSPDLRARFEPVLRHDLRSVRIHSDAEAAASARSFGAAAYTVGAHVFFGHGAFAPHTQPGRRLLAHELVHVVQQSSSPAGGAPTGVRVSRTVSYGTPSGLTRGETDEVSGTTQVPASAARQPGEPVEEAESRTVARAIDPRVPTAQTGTAEEPEGGLPVARSGGPGGTADEGPVPTDVPTGQPPPAAPTLSLTPGAQLTRGDQLTATVNFRPAAGETLHVTNWAYATASLGTVSRPSADPDFQTRWQGQMAASGTLQLGYEVRPAGQPAGAAQTLQQAVTVADRTGSPWVHAVTEEAERTRTGQPSPPRLFNQLGLHESVPASPFPSAVATTISGGPNAQLVFASSLTAGPFISRPHIHPDLTNNTSRFAVFHTDPSRLYMRAGAARTLIPLREYSNLAVSAGNVTFDVPNWETFYKAHRFLTVTATFGGRSIPLRDAWWGLDGNSPNANVVVQNDAAVRAALAVPAADTYQIAWSSNTWEGFRLMQSQAILTGTRSHEYVHAVHSHRANFKAMLRALDPQRKIESVVGGPGNAVDFAAKIQGWWTEILKPNHELVDEAASRTAEAFVATGGTMAGVNSDPATGAFLGSVWDISGDQEMT